MATNGNSHTQTNFNSIYYQNPNKKQQQQQLNNNSNNNSNNNNKDKDINPLNSNTNNKRSESVLRHKPSFSPNHYELYDREKMEEEMSKLLREINIKSKEYRTLRNSHFESEAQNLKTIKQIESLISDCKQIQSPIEKSNSTTTLLSSKNKSLLNNLKDTLSSYQQTLLNKDKQLTELKATNPKILRLFEIENKLINANETYEMIFMQYTNLAKKITNLDLDSQKATETRDAYKTSNAKLKQENDELKEKIAYSQNENNELMLKEKFFEERISMIKAKYSELKSVLKVKEESLEKSKAEMVKFQSLASEKDKSEALLNSQLKQIQMMRDQSEKKSKQIRELEKVQADYMNEINDLKANGKAPSARLYAIQRDKKAKDEEYEKLAGEFDGIKKEREELINKYKPKPFEKQLQINYSLNMPLIIEPSN